VEYGVNRCKRLTQCPCFTAFLKSRSHLSQGNVFLKRTALAAVFASSKTNTTTGFEFAMQTVRDWYMTVTRVSDFQIEIRFAFPFPFPDTMVALCVVDSLIRPSFWGVE
jgi:hypothetical protein